MPSAMHVPRVCVYTAVMGGYDPIGAVVQQTVPTEFICFTDGNDAPPGWQRVRASMGGLPPRLAAKHFKVLGHRVFPAGRLDVGGRVLPAQAFDYTIWIDGCVSVVHPRFSETLIAAVGRHDWAMFRHPHRSDIFAEAALSARMAKYRDEPLLEQVRSYAHEGFREKGLMMCTIIVRRARALSLAAVGEMWWRENCRWSIQDQVSLPVVLWRLGWGCDPIGGIDPFDNPLFARDVSHRMHEYRAVV
jgi:hypothetical protein